MVYFTANHGEAGMNYWSFHILPPCPYPSASLFLSSRVVLCVTLSLIAYNFWRLFLLFFPWISHAGVSDRVHDSYIRCLGASIFFYFFNFFFFLGCVVWCGVVVVDLIFGRISVWVWMRKIQKGGRECYEDAQVWMNDTTNQNLFDREHNLRLFGDWVTKISPLSIIFVGFEEFTR